MEYYFGGYDYVWCDSQVWHTLLGSYSTKILYLNNLPTSN